MWAFRKVAPLLVLLALASCADETSRGVASIGSRTFGSARGIDMATDARDNSNELKHSGLDFVARYYRDPASRWPTLSASEAQQLSSLGLSIVTVWEWHSHKPEYFSYASGHRDALAAHKQASAIGQPAGSAIYFAVDFNADAGAMSAVDQYFRGVAAGLAGASGGSPKYRIGVYGSGAVCGAIRAAGLAHYSWLSNSTAWAGSSNYDGWDIKQAGKIPELSFSHDYNEARREYGSFRLSRDVAAPHAEATR
jgi:Rv2525c-like, glycoside hydrolase-like domain